MVNMSGFLPKVYPHTCLTTDSCPRKACTEITAHLLQDGTTIKKEDLDAKAGGMSRAMEQLDLAETS